MPEHEEQHEDRRELAHPVLVLAWLLIVVIAALTPALERVSRHLAR